MKKRGRQTNLNKTRDSEYRNSNYEHRLLPLFHVVEQWHGGGVFVVVLKLYATVHYQQQQLR